MLSIDLVRAFDKVPWLTLYHALLAVSPQLAAYILDLRYRVKFQVQIGEHSRSVPGGRGLRQSCALAPTLRLVFAKALLCRIFFTVLWS